MRGTLLLSILLMLCLLFEASVQAADRALIVTIGQVYDRIDLTNIPGSERNAVLAKDIAKKMGFKEREIRVLREAQATRAAILGGLNWMKEGVKEGGKAYFYYSGHGGQVENHRGDPNDLCDEMLIPADAKWRNGENCIHDKEINAFVSEMEKGLLVFIIDSCFSGTMTKDVYGGAEPDFKLGGKAAPQCGHPTNLKSVSWVKQAQEEQNLVVMTASGKYEVSWSAVSHNGKGNIFTQGLYEAILRRKGILSFLQARDKAAQYIKTMCDRAEPKCIPSTPQLEGNPSLFDKDILLTGISVPYTDGVQQAGNLRELLERMVSNGRFGVALNANKSRVRVGEEISFSVVSTVGGYLNLMELEPDGKLHVIFPNNYVSTNRVSADVAIRVPEGIGGFKFNARPPAGKSSIVALVSRQPLNLYQEKDLGRRIGMFKSIEDHELGLLKEAFARSIGVQQVAGGGKEFGAANMVVETVK